MALDGITLACLVHELKEKLLGAKINKIYQPEKDELIIATRNERLLLCANSSHPRIHFTAQTKENPMTAPLFCMVLRKHLSGGKILDVKQPGFERIVEIYVESINEMGDMSCKKLIIEIMGKHSNIILTLAEDNQILDSIKHISFDKSSVRQVLPGLIYSYPPNQDKLNPLEVGKEEFLALFKPGANKDAQGAIYKSLSGISPVAAAELCTRANISPEISLEEISSQNILSIYNEFSKAFDLVRKNAFSCEAYYDKGKPMDFSCIPMTMLEHLEKRSFSNPSELLEFFYGEKDIVLRHSQKTYDLKKIVETNITRCVKKKELQERSLKDIKNRDQLKIKGELLTANIYELSKGMTTFTTQNYYEESLPDITISLDPNLTPAENAQSYFKRYNKQKRTAEALKDQVTQNNEELLYFEGLLNSISACTEEAEIEEIKEELAGLGYIKKRKKVKGQKIKKSKPLKFISADGFEIYVGKNNAQNDELTLKFARPNDIWLHTKDIPGSHVIIRCENKEVPTSTLTEAANLAALYSKAKNGSLVPVDYTEKRNVKKPNGAKPGFVIYENNKTAYITPTEVIPLPTA